jgi:hypothetical protein
LERITLLAGHLIEKFLNKEYRHPFATNAPVFDKLIRYDTWACTTGVTFTLNIQLLHLLGSSDLPLVNAFILQHDEDMLIKDFCRLIMVLTNKKPYMVSGEEVGALENKHGNFFSLED